MKKIYENHWSHILYTDGDDYYLSVLCGGAGIYSKDIKLTSKEKEKYKQSGNNFIDELANIICNSSDKFLKRFIDIKDV